MPRIMRRIIRTSVARSYSSNSSETHSRGFARPRSPSGVPLSRLLEPVFPLSIRQSLRQWHRRKRLRESEESLLDCVGMNPNSPKAPFRVRSLDVPVGNFMGPRLVMNELEVSMENTVNEKTEETAEESKHVVLLHGYGASKGFFYRNFQFLASQPNTTLHALDWLGYGLSTRAPWKFKNSGRVDGLLKAESWFIEALEVWRKQRNIPEFTLVAHSMGAYLGCAYASKYPEHVRKIALVSPAGVNRTDVALPAEELYGIKVAQNESNITATEILSPITAASPPAPRWFKWLWERHCSPFSLVRWTGPLGPKITSGWTSRRFAKLPQKEQDALQKYSYTMFNAKGSGEYLLNYFLAPGGVARWPLAERLQGVKCPTLWMYGDRDWMDINGGHEAVRRLRACGLKADLTVVPDSGHHLYLDNSRAFHRHLFTFL